MIQILSMEDCFDTAAEMSLEISANLSKVSHHTAPRRLSQAGLKARSSAIMSSNFMLLDMMAEERVT